MTLIAAIYTDETPAVFGDLVISSPWEPGRAVRVTAVGDATSVFPTGFGRAIRGVEQKVVLLAGNCVVAWSGTETVARTIVRDLRAIASQALLTSSAIAEYLSKLDPIDQRQITFVGWVHEGDHFEQFWFNASTGEGALFGRIAAGGTGANAFVGLASQISVGPTGQVSTLSGLDRVVVSLLSAMGWLFRAELGSQSTLLNLFGGGYEIATFVGNKFEKIGDILFIFWSAVVSDARLVELKVPSLIMKQDYEGETLLLQTLRVGPGKTSADPPATVKEKHVIGPFGAARAEPDPHDIRWPGMEAKYICHVIFVHSPYGSGVLTRINFNPSRASDDIRISVAGDEMTFWASQEFCQSLTESVRAGYAVPAT